MNNLHTTTNFSAGLSRLGLGLLLGVLVLAWGTPTAQAETAKVQPELIFKGASPHASFVIKLKSTLKAVTEKALKDQDDWTDQKGDYEDIIKDVLERAYRGYRVKKVSLGKSGSQITAKAELEAFGEIIKSVKIMTEVQPLPEFVNGILKPETKAIGLNLEKLWKNLPLQNVSWARGLMAEQVLAAAKNQENFSFFTPTVELKPGTEMGVLIILRAKAPLLKTVSLGLESTLIPNIMLEDIRFSLIPSLVDLRGLPIGFVKANSKVLFKPLEKSFIDQKLVKRLKLQTEIRATYSAQNLSMRALIFSPRFRLRASGLLDVGRSAEEGRLDGHIGVMAGKHIEVFVDPAVEVGPMRLVADVGVMFHPTDWFRVGVGRDLEYDKDKWWANMDITPQFGLNYESRAVRGLHRELGLWYKPNEFYRFGLYSDLKKDIWLRLRANL